MFLCCVLTYLTILNIEWVTNCASYKHRYDMMDGHWSATQTLNTNSRIPWKTSICVLDTPYFCMSKFSLLFLSKCVIVASHEWFDVLNTVINKGLMETRITKKTTNRKHADNVLYILIRVCIWYHKITPFVY